MDFRAHVDYDAFTLGYEQEEASKRECRTHLQNA